MLDVSPTLRLRPINIQDARPLADLVDANRTYLRQWLPWVDGSRGEDDTRAFITSELARQDADQGLVFVIEEHGEPCGVVGFNQINTVNRYATIGYWMAEAFQGRGIMTASVRRLERFAFETLDLNRVSIVVAIENKRSRSVPERLGYRQEGILRENEWLYDHFVDHALYARLCRERLADQK